MKLDISENIRKLRKGRGLTQERLAEIMGVTVGAVSKWEAGSSTPDLSLIVEMADFFETSVDALLGYDWHSGRVSETVARIRELRNEKRFDEASTEAEKALERYPNCFDVAFHSAIMYSMKGVELECDKSLRRSLSLFERALELVGQNTNEQVNEWSIRKNIASVYILLGQAQKALEHMKKNNVDGINDADIGFVLATKEKKPDEALDYLSKAMVTGVSRLIQIAIGYSSAYKLKSDYASAAEIMDWAVSLLSGFELPDATSYYDKHEVQLLTECARSLAACGDLAGARTRLERARDAARKFDADPRYDYARTRYHVGEGRATAFDNFGKSALDGIKTELAENKESSEALLGIWEEILNG